MLTANQIRAARTFFNLEQQVVADAVGVSKMTISDIENEKTTAKSKTIDAIQKFFELRGLEFTPDGGLKPSNNIVQVYDGADAYLKLLDDVGHVLGKSGELLKSGADERRSSPQVIEKNRTLRKAGIKMRSLIRNEDTHVMGDVSEYRWMNDKLYTDGDVKLIYGNRVAYLITWTETPRTIIIQDKTIAEEQRRVFEFIWGNSIGPTESTTAEKYE